MRHEGTAGLEVAVSGIEKWSVHELAQCNDCDWYSEDRDAVRRAGEHHRRTNHTVTGERGTAFRYSADMSGYTLSRAIGLRDGAKP